jgi:amino acid transporter
VTLGGVLAVATSVNGTMLVPARLAVVLAGDRLLPRWVGYVNANTGAPTPALVASFGMAAGLLVSGPRSLARNIAVFALVVVYLLNSLALLFLPSRNPELFASARTGVSLRVQRIAGVVSVVGMAVLVVVQLVADIDAIRSSGVRERFETGALTCLELFVIWGGLGMGVYAWMRRRGAAQSE